MIRVSLPAHLRTLARIEGEALLDIPGEVSMRSVLDVLETRYPMLRGTLRDPNTLERRAFVRFFACGEDISHAPPDDRLPEEIASGQDVLRIIGAMSGG